MPPPKDPDSFVLTYKISKRNHLGSPHPHLRGPRPPTGNPGSATGVYFLKVTITNYTLCAKKKRSMEHYNKLHGCFNHRGTTSLTLECFVRRNNL